MRTAPPRRRPKVHPNTLKRVRLAVYQRDGFRCRHCGWQPNVPAGYDGRYALGERDTRPGRKRFAVRVLQLDHIHPFSLGGRFEESNLQALCTTCNVRKGATV
jgi:5-methylcytosine-specific restriction endonuclease McrA